MYWTDALLTLPHTRQTASATADLIEGLAHTLLMSPEGWDTVLAPTNQVPKTRADEICEMILQGLRPFAVDSMARLQALVDAQAAAAALRGRFLEGPDR